MALWLEFDVRLLELVDVAVTVPVEVIVEVPVDADATKLPGSSESEALPRYA